MLYFNIERNEVYEKLMNFLIGKPPDIDNIKRIIKENS